jgi:gliding motility-associated-like protein
MAVPAKAYNYAKTITIQSGKVYGVSLTDFPVLIKHTDPDLRHVSYGGHVESLFGYDIKFTSSVDGSSLDMELEDYDPTTGRLVCWVRVPSLSGTINTDLVLNYGEGSIFSDQSTPTTWDSNFKAVYHLNSAPFVDASSKTGLLSNSGATSIAAYHNSGIFLNDNHVESPVSSEIQLSGDLTLDVWVNVNNYRGGTYSNTLFSCGGLNELSSDNYLFYMNIDATNIGDKRIRTFWEYGPAFNENSFSNASISNVVGDWTKLSMTRNSSSNQVVFYQDGVQIGSPISYTFNPNGGGNNALRLGKAQDDETYYLDGMLDEARISNTVRSSDWIRTDYENQSAGGTFDILTDTEAFYEIGSETALVVNPPTTWTGSVNTSSNDEGIATAISDIDGSVYVVGKVGSAEAFPGAIRPYQGDTDAFVAKYNSAGDLVWSTHLGTSGQDGARDVVIDDAGNVYVTGYYRNTGDFIADGAATLQGAGASDAFLISFTPDGGTRWKRSFGGSSQDAGLSVAIHESKLYFVMGYDDLNDDMAIDGVRPQGAIVDQDSHYAYVSLNKDDASTNWFWYIGQEESPDISLDDPIAEEKLYPSDIVCDGTGNYLGLILNGSITMLSNNGGASFSTPASGGIDRDAYILKFSEDGTIGSFTNYGVETNYPGEFLSLAIDCDHMYLARCETGLSPYVRVTKILKSNGSIANVANMLLTDVIPDRSVVRDIAINDRGSLFMVGRLFGQMTYNTSSGSQILNSTGDEDMFFLELDENLLVEQAFVGGQTGNEAWNGIDISPVGEIVLTGYSQNGDEAFLTNSVLGINLSATTDIAIQRFYQTVPDSQCCAAPAQVDASLLISPPSFNTGDPVTLTAQGVLGQLTWHLTSSDGTASTVTGVNPLVYNVFETISVTAIVEGGCASIDSSNTVNISPIVVPPTITCPGDELLTALAAECEADLTYAVTAQDGSGNDCAPIDIANYDLVGELNGHRYFKSTTALSWPDAKLAAEALGGHLATISSSTEDNLLLGLGSCWIGLSDQTTEGTFEWVTGEPLSYTNWVLGQPNDPGGHDFVRINSGVGQEWDDVAPSSLQYIVEFECSLDQIEGLPSGATFPAGTTTVSYTATDGLGQTISCSFDVVVNAVQDATITSCAPDITTSADPGVCEATAVALGSIITAASCGVATVSNDAPFSYPLGTSTVTWTNEIEPLEPYAALPSPKCRYERYFPSVLNSTGGLIQIGNDVTITNTPAATLTTNSLTSGTGTTCDGIPCLSSSDYAPVLSIAINTGTGIDGSLNSAATITGDMNYDQVDVPDGEILVITGDVTLRTTGRFRMGVGSTLEINGNVNLLCQEIDLRQDVVVNVNSGSLNLLSNDLIDVNRRVGINAPSSKDIRIYGNADIRIHENSKVLGFVYATGEIQLKTGAVLYGRMTASSLTIDNSAVVVGIGRPDCRLGPGQDIPEILNYNSEITYAIAYPENATNFIVDYDGVDAQDEEGSGLVWSIGGVDSGQLNIDAGNGQLTFMAAPDFESPLDSNMDNVYTVMVTLTDQDGNSDTQELNITIKDIAAISATCEQTVTVTDDEAPTFGACPIDIIVNNDAGDCSAVVNYTSPVGADNCPGSITSQTLGFATGSAFPVGITTNTFVVTDGAGTTASCSFTVTVTDTEDPTITCPADVVTVTNTGCTATGVALGTPTVGDNCGTNAPTNDAPAAYPVGVTNVTWTVTDAAGNAATCIQTVTVTDTEDPTITCPADVVTVTNTGCTATGVALGTPTVGDNCGANAPTNDAPAAYPVGVTNVTWTVTDAAGNAATCIQTVTVTDTEDPTITCPADVVTVTNTGCTATGVALGTPTVGDNCGANAPTNDAPAAYPVGVTNVTWTVTDAAGNAATCIQTVTVTDTEDPTITCPADVVTVTNTGCTATGVALGTPTVGDNCGTNAPTNDAPAAYPVGVTNVTWTVTDAAGNAATCIQTVTVTDTEDPTITCPADVVTVTNTGCTATGVALGIPTVGDNCGANAPTNDAPAAYPLGVTNVTWTVTDAAGNAATCIQTVTVTDTEDPTITCPADVVTVTNTGCTATGVALGTPTVGDNCGTNAPTNDAPAAYPVGVTNVTWTLTDAAGNAATCIQTVTVTDGENPNIVSCPPNDVVSSDATCGYLMPDYIGLVVATDNCTLTGDLVISQDPIAGSPQTGPQTVTITVSDEVGNTSTCDFDVTVVDTTDPTLSNCPVDITEALNSSCEFTLPDYWNVITVADNCTAEGDLILTQDPPASTVISGHGTAQTVVLIVTDANGNTNTCSFVITLEDVTFPSIDCPLDIVQNVDAGECSAVVTYAAPITAENCGGLVTIQTAGLPSGTAFPAGETTNTFVTTDLAGNSVACSFIVTVIDNESPSLTCPIDYTVALDENCEYSLPDLTSDVLVSDNCSSAGMITLAQTNPQATPLTGHEEEYIFTIEALDENGNQSSCSVTITTEDQTAPEVMCPEDITVGTDPDQCTVELTLTPVTATDNCGATYIFNDYSGADPVATFNSGETTVTWQVGDGNGNFRTCPQIITVIDEEAPMMEITQLTVPMTECEYTLIDLTDQLGISDNCTVNADLVTVSSPAIGTILTDNTMVTYTITDASGNMSESVLELNLIDVTAPIIECVEDIQVTAEEGFCELSVSVPLPDYSDCDGAELIWIQGEEVYADGIYPLGITTLEWQAVDASGNSSSCSMNVTVLAASEASLTCPTDIEVPAASSNCMASLAIDMPYIEGFCSPVISNSFNAGEQAQGDFPVGETIVTYTVQDFANELSCSVVVTVFDETLPTLTCPPAIAQCGLEVIMDQPEVMDLCGEVTIINDFNSTDNGSDVYPHGITNVLWTAADEYGNEVSCFTIVEVQDNSVEVSAGEDLNLDYVYEFNLEAILPTVASGIWTVVQGVADLSDLTDPNASISGYGIGTTILEWTVDYGLCGIHSDQIVIMTEGFLIPTGFSPNQDGINDRFYIRGLEALEGNVEMEVFTRWGTKVYSSKAYQNDWDGRNLGGNQLPADTYYIIIKLPDGTVEKGSIELRK